MPLDYDLQIIQEARNMARAAAAAQETLETYTQQQLDCIVKAMVDAALANAEWLAQMAVDETKYGIYEHKVIKNTFASQTVYEYIKDMKTKGIINEDPINKVIEAAVPVGVVMGIIPTTNPTSTLIHNALCAVKSGNAIVFSPHPRAIKCSCAAAQVLQEAAAKAGAPDGTVGCLSKVSSQAVEELMHDDHVAVIVATGGSGLVKAAYSAGKPALGVGPGNVPAYIERTANVRQAVKDIITSKTFDNGMICASEQAIIADEVIKDQVTNELLAQGCYIMNAEEIDRVAKLIMTPTNGMNAAFVGKTADYLATHANVPAPPGTKLLIAPMDGYGPEYPLSHEKLTTVLGFYTCQDWHDGCALCIELLKLGGIGHSLVIHSQDDAVIREFIRKPVSRILANTPSALGGIGYSTGIAPSLTLGCGTSGGSSLSENLTPLHLINVKKLAYGVMDVDLTKASPAANCQPSALNNEAVIANVVQQVLAALQNTQ